MKSHPYLCIPFRLTFHHTLINMPGYCRQMNIQMMLYIQDLIPKDLLIQ